jgi:toxin-antitoxin system, toxin component, bro family
MTTKEFEKERKEKVMAQRFEIFSKENLGSVRTVFNNDEPWFCVPDVCKILDLKNPTVATQRIDEEDKAKFNLGLINSEFVNFVNESGLYQLIMRSKKPEAKIFIRWITKEVIPSIRKHGYYSNAPQIDERDRAKLAVVNAATEEERMIAFGIYNEKFVLPMQKELEAARPKAENYDDFMNREGTFSSGEIAKPFGLTAVMFNKIMKRFGLIVKHGKGGWEPSAKYLSEGIMKPVEYELKPKNSSSSLLQSSAKPPLLTSESKEESAVDKLNAIAAKFIDGFEYAGKKEKTSCTEQEAQAGANLFQGKAVSFRWTARGLEKAKEILVNESFVELKAGKWELSRERIKKFKEEIKSGQA